MTLSERINIFEHVFYDLQETTSLNMKRTIVDEIPAELKEDFEFILECLAGKHIFGYRFETLGTIRNYSILRNETDTVKNVLEFLLEPNKQKDLSTINIERHVSQVVQWWYFFEQIVDRTLKLGIGKSLLPKDGLSAMLAKKYEGKIKEDRRGYFITEKLDGNRCIAHYDGTRWIFTSRNGKQMHVDFDMSGLPKEYVYDGEILSPQQVKMSEEVANVVINNLTNLTKFDCGFNETSGLINRHDTNKELVYNIFDIMYDDVDYIDRREVLSQLKPISEDIRILPTLAYVSNAKALEHIAAHIMNNVVTIGGEGVMINLASAKYQHKRTDGLLKFKPVYSMDMRVVDFEIGSGKYEYAVGALICEIRENGKIIRCKVGTGLSDEQRETWYLNPDLILGKIIQVGYFSLSQNSEDFGTNVYSLRFPRLIKVRNDKNETSIY